MDWTGYPYQRKLQILEGESSVYIPLLLKDETLVNMIKQGESKADCLAYINENW